MIRRLQLLGPGSRAAGRVVAAGVRIWDGLLRDNKVIPAVFAILALIIFAWILAGALVGGEPGEERKGQVANQASQAQSSQDPDSGGSETPAPGVENRDADSYSAFEKKDPFRDIGVEKTDDNGGGSNNDGGGSGGENDRGGRSGNGSGSGDSTNQPFPGDRESGGSSGGDRGGGSGGGDDGQGRAGRGAGQGSGTGHSGNAGQGDPGDLFDSGGDLIVP